MHVTELTITDVKRILERAAGASADADWHSPEAVGTPFVDMGYDSLAILQMAMGLELEYGVEVGEDRLHDLVTPGDVLVFVNTRLAGR
jgi:minimal PKS acyl carrier protein